MTLDEAMFDLDPDSANVMPSRYRQVSVAGVDSLDADDLVAHFTGREAYTRTRFVVARLRDQSERCALVELARDQSTNLFSPARSARVLAPAEECVYVRDEGVDPGIASHLAALAQCHPARRAVVVEGRYRHVSFILNAEPFPVTVVDVIPPVPSRLADQVQRVLDSTEDLPPIVVTDHVIDSRDLLAEAGLVPSAEVLVPCRGGGDEIDGMAVSYLDERPEPTTWTLLGCERSQQIHRWFYGAAPAEAIDWCPRRLIGCDGAASSGRPVLSRCCMLEEGVERRDGTVWVPWGATLGEVRQALDLLTGSQEYSWTRT